MLQVPIESLLWLLSLYLKKTLHERLQNSIYKSYTTITIQRKVKLQ